MPPPSPLTTGTHPRGVTSRPSHTIPWYSTRRTRFRHDGTASAPSSEDRTTVIIALVAACLLAGRGCGSSSRSPRPPSAAPRSAETGCPAKRASGMLAERLADRIHAPSTARAGCPTRSRARSARRSASAVRAAELSVDKDRSYLALFVWRAGSGEIHVNLRGYPGRTTIPDLHKEDTNGTKTVKTKVPCFSDPGGIVKAQRHRGARLHRQPGRRPLARPLRLALRGRPLHREPARRAAAQLSQGRAEPRPDLEQPRARQTAFRGLA